MTTKRRKKSEPTYPVPVSIEIDGKSFDQYIAALDELRASYKRRNVLKIRAAYNDWLKDVSGSD